MLLQHQLAKSISKEMYNSNNMSKCLIIFGIKDETTINKLLSDLKIHMNNSNISYIVLNNGVLYKINLNNNQYTMQSLMKSFINVRKNNIDLYSKLCLRPGQSYEDRHKSKILSNGASLKPGNFLHIKLRTNTFFSK